MRRWPLALAITLTAGVLALLLSPRVPLDPERLMHEGDKVAHAAMFAVLAAAWCWAGVPPRLTWCAGLVLAIATEAIQGAFIPSRSGDVLDAVADLVGATVAVAAFAWLRRRRVASAALVAR